MPVRRAEEQDRAQRDDRGRSQRVAARATYGGTDLPGVNELHEPVLEPSREVGVGPGVGERLGQQA
jgi:hypothetical protein